MQRHPYFNLWLHEDAELALLLESPVVERTTLHEWPLSCVQRLRLADGRTSIYKAQAPPTVEPEFYASVRSSLLVTARILDVADGPAALLLDDIAAPRLAELALSEAETLHTGEFLLEQIARSTGAPPIDADISTEAKWAAYASTILTDLSELIATGTFRQVDRSLITKLARQVEAPDVLAAICSPSGLVHRDLSGDNILCGLDGFRIIDWQRPIIGPVALDLANLIDALGFEPQRYVAAGVVRLLYLLRIAWCAQCARRWFPPGAATYDAAIARLARRMTEGTNETLGHS